MLWALTGIGMIVNTITGMSRAAKMRKQVDKQREEMLAQMQNVQNNHAQSFQSMSMPGLQAQNIPTFPESAYSNLEQLQQSNWEERSAFQNNFQSRLDKLTGNFYKENHFQTTTGPDGKPTVKLDNNGQPLIGKGQEDGLQRATRMDYFSNVREELGGQHDQERQAFREEKGQFFRNYIEENRSDLSKPEVQKSLHDMLRESRLEAMGMQERQDKEMLLSQLPPDQEIQNFAAQGIEEMQSMSQRHLQSEQDSPHVKEIVAYQDELASKLGVYREQIQQQRSREAFLHMDPRKAFAPHAVQNAAINSPDQIGMLLPGYLSSHLYEVGAFSHSA